MKFLNSTDYPTSQLRALIIATRRFCADEKKLKALNLPWRTWRTSGTITGIEVRNASKARPPKAELFGWESTATFGSTFKLRVWVPRESTDANLQLAAAIVRAHLVTSLDDVTSDAAMRHRAAVLRICRMGQKVSATTEVGDQRTRSDFATSAAHSETGSASKERAIAACRLD